MQIINGVPMYYFTPDEFYRPAVKDGQIIDWTKRLCPRLLVLYDVQRNMWGQRISVSNGDGTVGRESGGSEHSIMIDGIVRAIDCVPDGVLTVNDAERFYGLAYRIGFTSVGFYPQWNQGAGFHLGTRTDRRPGYPATWGYVDGQYVSLQAAFDCMRRQGA